MPLFQKDEIALMTEIIKALKTTPIMLTRSIFQLMSHQQIPTSRLGAVTRVRPAVCRTSCLLRQSLRTAWIKKEVLMQGCT